METICKNCKHFAAQFNFNCHGVAVPNGFGMCLETSAIDIIKADFQTCKNFIHKDSINPEILNQKN